MNQNDTEAAIAAWVRYYINKLNRMAAETLKGKQ